MGGGVGWGESRKFLKDAQGLHVPNLRHCLELSQRYCRMSQASERTGLHASCGPSEDLWVPRARHWLSFAGNWLWKVMISLSEKWCQWSELVQLYGPVPTLKCSQVIQTPESWDSAVYRLRSVYWKTIFFGGFWGREDSGGLTSMNKNSYFTSCLWGTVGLVISLRVLDGEGERNCGKVRAQRSRAAPERSRFPCPGVAEKGVRVEGWGHGQTCWQTGNPGACISALSTGATQQEPLLAAPRVAGRPSSRQRAHLAAVHVEE